MKHASVSFWKTSCNICAPLRELLTCTLVLRTTLEQAGTCIPSVSQFCYDGHNLVMALEMFRFSSANWVQMMSV